MFGVLLLFAMLYARSARRELCGLSTRDTVYTAVDAGWEALIDANYLDLRRRRTLHKHPVVTKELEALPNHGGFGCWPVQWTAERPDARALRGLMQFGRQRKNETTHRQLLVYERSLYNGVRSLSDAWEGFSRTVLYGGLACQA